MLGIKIGPYHTYNDWALILGRIDLQTPTPKAYKIDIEGADGTLDVTDFFGEVKYNDFTQPFPFTMTGPQEEYSARHDAIKNAIHGKKLRIILDDMPGFFYMGRVTVGSLANEKGYAAFDIVADCEPYKYKLEKTTVTKAITGSGAVSLTNSRKRAVPTITASAAFTLTFGPYTWTISAGTYTLPELELVEGANVVSVTGTGTISLTWQEGGL